MPRRQRIAVGILFSLGFIVTIAGVVRTWFIYKSLFNENFDQTWYVYPLWIAAAVEIDLGVVCQTSGICQASLTLSLDLCFSSRSSSSVEEDTLQFIGDFVPPLFQEIVQPVLKRFLPTEIRQRP